VPIDTRITLQKLEIFECVVELGSVTRAAERLFVAQPVVTAHIRSLESRLGARLFYREGRRIQLTEAGRAVHLWASDLLRRTRELDRHLETLSDGRHGTIAVGASMAVGGYLLPPVLAAFRRERPFVEIRLNILDSEHAIADTLAAESDFAVVFCESDPTSDALLAELIGVEELVLVAAPAFDVPDRICVDELARLPFVEVPRGLVRRRFVERELLRFGISERSIAIECGHAEAMKHVTREGLGVALLSRGSVAESIARGELREIAIEGLELGAPIYLVRRKDKVLTALHDELVAAIRALFAPLDEDSAEAPPQLRAVP
jgi:DNA-binding transcriptional LysR family regulator